MAERACILAERVRKAVENSVTVCSGKSLKVTVSLGLSQLATADDAARLIRRADDALYKSKEAGRNCGHWNTGEACIRITAAASARKVETRPNAPAPAPASVPVTAAEQRMATGTSFLHVLKRRVTESHRFGIPLSIMHLKIEDYDEVTRNHGKAVARQMVDASASALEKALREMDVLARLENGEFVAMLPGNTQAEAGQIAKRMRIAMNRCVVPLPDREIHVQVRLSIAELGVHETAQELLVRVRQGFVGARVAPGRSASGI
jgi:diguanylate cyclase (GGDEF)-like protein